MEYLAPHPLREKASGRPVVMVPLILYSNDLSDNRSKNGTFSMPGMLCWPDFEHLPVQHTFSHMLRQ